MRTSEIVVDSPYLRLRKDSIDLPSGGHVDEYYVRESRGFAVVFARTGDGRIVLVRQYKHGIGEFVRELPAGAIDPHESAETCAVRELAEETGYAGDPPRLITEFIADPTNSTSRLYLYAIDNAERRFEQDLDRTEVIDVELVTPRTLLDMVRTGAIAPMAHVACIYYVLDQERAVLDQA